MTAASVAEAHFRAELDALHHVGPAATTNGSSTATAMPTTNTLVVLHDSCYGHRYSRPRTSRSTLSSIVERPERLLAAVLGVAAAYVRLGERHAEGSVPPVPQPDLCVLRERAKLPFRILRTTRRVQLGSPAVTNVHGTRWMDELKIMCDSAEARLAMNGKELQRPDMGNGRNGEERKELHEGDLYLCAESLEALEGALGAVCEAVDAVFTAKQGGPSRAFVAIRPPGHHCSVSYPSGFCWINNVHVGIMHAMLTHGLTHAAIIDFDLHHGDGSQAIAWQHNTRSASAAKNAAAWKRTSIGYFSLHDINSYPCEMGNEEKVKGASICIENAHGQNVWNVHLQPWRTEAEFWQLYETRYAVLLEKARNFLRQQTEKWRATSGQEPKGAVFLSAGFDASEWESSEMQRHAVNVPTDFYARMSRDVVKLAAEKETACEGRVISVLEGGYSDRAITSGVLSHLGGLAGEDPVPIKKEKMSGGLAFEMGQRIGALGSDATDENNDTAPAYDPAWWTVGALEKLEAAVHAPPPEPKKPPRSVTTPTYSSPTQSSAAKVVLVPRVRRSVSGLSALASASVSRAPTPPPPDVDWPVAAHELSKLLIPSDRTTTSCKPEELSAEATRARRDRQSLLLAAGQLPASAPSTPCAPSTAAAGPVPAPVRMALRERKPVAKPIGSIDEEAEEKPQPDRGRRKSLTLGEKVSARLAVAQLYLFGR